MLPLSLWAAPLLAQGADVHHTVLRGQWQERALVAVTPNYSWASHSPVAAAPRASRTGLTAELVFPLRNLGAVSAISISEASEHGLRQISEGTRWQREATSRLGSQLQENMFAPAVSALVGDSRVTVEAVFVQQHYASHALGLGRSSTDRQGHGLMPNVADATGTGVALSYETPLSEGISAYASVRSEVNMDPLQQYRGIYADPGQFDIPGGIGVGLTRRLGESAWVQLGVERVLYSDVDTFTSRALPARFLGLLGDSTSPSFEWQDLTVYSAAVGAETPSSWWWELRYSTQQQPEPTSQLLSRALEEQYSDSNFAFGFGRPTGASSSFRLTASYAARAYFLGSPTVGNFTDGGEQIEFEALWQVNF
jgi:hypothetical protein